LLNAFSNIIWPISLQNGYIKKMDDLLSLTADIVSAHLANNTVASGDVPALIKATFDALQSLSEPQVAEAAKLEPAVSIRASVKPDYIVCLEDGKKLKMLKRYIASRYNMTPAEYRAKWGLPSDYPMVAPNYSATRKELALNMGLGRKPATTSVKPKAAPAKSRGRKAAVQKVPAPVAIEDVAKPAKAGRKPRKTLGISAALDAGRGFLQSAVGSEG
jgi:predicted transcriptional regulator